MHIIKILINTFHILEKKIGDESFREVLNAQYAKYQEISQRANALYEKLPSDKEPHEASAMNKMMTWWGVQMKTMSDQSNSNVSELLLNGTNMGVIEGRRLINQNPHINSDIHTLLCDFVKMQEKSYEELKNFL